MAAHSLVRPTRPLMVDYSKWDMLDSDDEDAKASTSAPARTMTDDRRAHHDQSMALIAGWAREADPRLSGRSWVY